MRLLDIKRVLALFLVLSCMAAGPGRSLAQEEPLEQLRQSVDELMAILDDPVLSQPQMRHDRDERLEKVVRKRFNLTEMARLTLARHWRDLNPDQQEQFTELFAELLRNTYIGRVEEYYEKEIKISFRNQEIRDDRANVSSVVSVNGTETPTEYRLSRVDGEWLVYDVVIEGVSMIRNYRTQFSRIIEREKFAGLVRRIEERIKSGETS